MDLLYITQTEYYAGLFKSSPKVTCHLTGEVPIPGVDEPEIRSGSWECGVCAYRNPPGPSPAAARTCGLCGVPRMSVPPSTSSLAITPHLSSSLPSSSISLSASLAAESHSGRKQTEIACPACTFLNHPLLRECEMCGSELPRAKGDLQSAPSSRPLSPDLDDDGSPRMIKLSFRKGGDKPFYTVLKSSLKSKAWEVGEYIHSCRKCDTNCSAYVRRAFLQLNRRVAGAWTARQHLEFVSQFITPCTSTNLTDLSS